jgi:hypothetical protein
MLRVRFLAAGACVGVLLSACSESEAGSPWAGGPTSTTTDGGGLPEPGSSTPPATPSSSSPFNEVDPCELLSDEDRTRLQLERGKPKTIARSRGCDWTTASTTESWGVAISFKETFAFKDADLRGAKPVQVNIGRHEAYRVENAGGGRACEIFIITGEQSFVQVIVTQGVDIAGACETAVTISSIVDPKLP